MRRKSGVVRALIITLIIVFAFFVFFQSKWDGKSRFTIVIQNIDKENSPQDYNLIVFSVEASEKRGNYLLVRPDFMMDIPYGYKMYPVYSIYKLGELDKERGGEKILIKSVETTLGIKTDRYLLFKSKNFPKLPDSEDAFLSFKKNNFSFISLMPFFRAMLFYADTDMGFVEKLRFFMAVRQIKPSDFHFIDLSATGAAVPSELPDKSEVKIVDLDIFDYLIDSDFHDMRVRSEKFTIEVQNATNQAKIASQFSRILNNIGAHVVYLTTAKDRFTGSCRIVFYNMKSSDSVIASILKRDYHCEGENGNNIQSQSDMKVVIGEAFLK